MTVQDITATPELWRAGDIAEFTFDGIPGHSGPLRRMGNNWWVGDTCVILGIVTDLRVTRPAPVLPEHDGAVIQWREGEDYTSASWEMGMWYIGGDRSDYTRSALLERIGGAPITVATFAPLDGSTGGAES